MEVEVIIPLGIQKILEIILISMMMLGMSSAQDNDQLRSAADELVQSSTNKNPKSPRGIAVIEDDESWQLTHSDFIQTRLESLVARTLGGRLDIYPSGEALLIAMDRGERYRLYLLDGNLGKNFLKGWEIAPEIRLRHPNALIIGVSGGVKDDENFQSVGVTHFSKEASFSQVYLEIVKIVLASK